MDLNAVYECIGYGATRAVASTSFQDGQSRIPARYILENMHDPVEYCIEAYSARGTGIIAVFDDQERALIMKRLKREAGVCRH